MAKSILLKVLVDNLGAYVEDLSAENLKVHHKRPYSIRTSLQSSHLILSPQKSSSLLFYALFLQVGVLSGKIELRDLKLKRSALDNLDIPVEVHHGK